jgi:alkyl sulfatase BDS1-like metallo-beta-lactamase superfamily hydrolase
MAPPPCGSEDAKVTLTREALSRVLEGKSKLDDELKSGGIKVTGKSPKAFDDFVGALVTFDGWYNAVTPVVAK